MKEIKLTVPLCDQFHATHDPQWAHRMCAVCSLWMILRFNNRGSSLSAGELMKEIKASDGYLENIGWKHNALVQAGANHGLKLNFAKLFFYSPEAKKKAMEEIINPSLEKGQPVIISVFHRLDPARGSHMVVVNGVQEFNDKTIGYWIQDPDANFRGHNYFLTLDDFIHGWRGGLIWPQ